MIVCDAFVHIFQKLLPFVSSSIPGNSNVLHNVCAFVKFSAFFTLVSIYIGHTSKCSYCRFFQVQVVFCTLQDLFKQLLGQQCFKLML